MTGCTTWPSAKTKLSNTALICPFCGIPPKVETEQYGFKMGMLMTREDGTKYDPWSGQCYATRFKCKSRCPGNITIQLDSPNPQAFYDRVDRSKTRLEIHNEAIAKWNTRT